MTRPQLSTAPAFQVAALPWRVGSGGLEFLLITSRESGHWLIPKGWPMAGKSDRDAALQEAFEEAGLRGVGSVLPIGAYPFFKVLPDGSELACTMSVFGMYEVEELDEWQEKSQRQRRWVPQVEAVDLIFDWNLARFVAQLTVEVLRGTCGFHG